MYLLDPRGGIDLDNGRTWGPRPDDVNRGSGCRPADLRAVAELGLDLADRRRHTLGPPHLDERRSLERAADEQRTNDGCPRYRGPWAAGRCASTGVIGSAFGTNRFGGLSRAAGLSHLGHAGTRSEGNPAQKPAGHRSAGSCFELPRHSGEQRGTSAGRGRRESDEAATTPPQGRHIARPDRRHAALTRDRVVLGSLSRRTTPTSLRAPD